MRSASTGEASAEGGIGGGAGDGGGGRSLAGHLAVLAVPALVLLFVFDAVSAYRDARQVVDAAHDRSLRVALTLLRTGAVGPGEVPALLAESLGAGEDEVHFAFVDRGGSTLEGDSDLPYARPDAVDPLRFRNGHHRGRPVRVASLLVGADEAVPRGSPAIFVVSESTRVRVDAVFRLVLHEMRRHMLAALVVLVLGWIWARRARRALAAPAEALARREAEDMTPLAVDEVPREIRPLVDAVNDHLGRLAGLFEASRRFAADVAHQLRTPLTLLGAQAQYALRQDDPAQLRESIEGIAAASRGAQRLCNQMLSLSRIEAAKGAIRDGVRIDLAAMLRETALDLSVLAIEKRIDLAFEDGGGPVFVVGHEIMLHELFSNLIDNALRYTPRAGRVRIDLRTVGGAAEVDVRDSGPGIPPERREMVFQRFHRRLDRPGGHGSGLGLAIAHQIALVHRGTIAFEDPADGDGFLVRVHLPIAGAAVVEASKGS